jgi:hypothetical protein
MYTFASVLKPAFGYLNLFVRICFGIPKRSASDNLDGFGKNCCLEFTATSSTNSPPQFEYSGFTVEAFGVDTLWAIFATMSGTAPVNLEAAYPPAAYPGFKNSPTTGPHV